MSDDQHETLPDLTEGIEIQRIPEGGISAGNVGNERIFLWRNGDRLKAYSANCPHLGGPLDKGILANGIIRCPWHHACFDLASGEATAAPAFDALPEYSVVLSGSRASVKSACTRKARNMRQREASLGTMAIVGGGAAGFAAADALRKGGWRGEITIFSEEDAQPYDRTLLTKDYLEGAFGDDRLPVGSALLG